MSWKKNLTIVSTAISISTLTLHIINKFIYNQASDSENFDSGNNYKWKFGNIFYTRQGTGSPILLIHDLSCYSSHIEWNKIIEELASEHTVYTIDLLGCGKSDKPNITYTCYMYVQLINDFIKDIIKEKSDVVATGISGAFTIAACQNDPSNINQIIWINPESMNELSRIPTSLSKTRSKLINIPVFGTFLYNTVTKKEQVKKLFREKYYYNESNIDENLINIYYSNAHTSHAECKYLYSSMIGKYTTINISHCLKSLNNSIYIIAGKGNYENEIIADEYKIQVPAIEIIGISNTNHLPQLENPEELIEQIDILLNDSQDSEV